MRSSPHLVTLTCHPEALSTVVRRIDVRVRRSRDGVIALAFVLNGDLGRLRIPPPAPPRQADRLWEHTCFEAFVAADRSPAYHEFNFAPSGEWAVYAFRGYRERAAIADDPPAPEIRVSRAADGLEVGATVPLNCLAAEYTRVPLRVALAAVIEDADGVLSYWALRHPPGKPDFHHPDGFALRLGVPDVDSLRDPR